MPYIDIYTALLPVKQFLQVALGEGLKTYTPKKYSGSDFNNNVKDWLDALFDELPTDSSDPQQLQTWAWQMAVCMAIDLRSHTKSVYHYLHLLEHLEFGKIRQKPISLSDAVFPHMLFEQAAKSTGDWKSLHSSKTFDGKPIQYVRIVSLYSYLRRSIKAKINGRYVDVSTLDKLLKKRTRLSPDDPEAEDWGIEIDTYLNLPDVPIPEPINLNELAETAEFAGPPPDKFSWVLPYSEFVELMACATSSKCSQADLSRIVTGRPVRSGEDECTKFQVYIVLPESHEPPAYQPWAGAASWKDFYPFLSFLKQDGFGRTFNLRKGTTKPHHELTARERIFEPINMPPGSIAYLLQDMPVEEDCAREPVLWEAIERFNKASLISGDLFKLN